MNLDDRSWVSRVHRVGLRYFSELVTATTLSAILCVPLQAENWDRFRGPNGAGVSESKGVPTKWNSTEGIKWTYKMPGPGASSPIIWGDDVFVTCYTGYGVNKDNPGNLSDLKRHLLCIDRTTGKLKWQTSVDSTQEEDPYKGFISEHGYASSTPVTDGLHVYVMFGKTGVIAFDREGKEVWRKHVGTKSDPAQWGDGASPLLYKNILIVNAGITDHAMIGFNKLNGDEVWRITDEKFTNGWSTPIVVTANGRDELVCSTPGKVFALDPLTGKEYWRAKSPIQEAVCASVAEHAGVVYLMGGRQGAAIGVRAGGSGDVSSSNTVWQKPLRSGIGTPVVAEGKLFWSSSGLAICADCATGEELFKERLKRPDDTAAEPAGRGPRGDYASAIVVGDKVLVLSRDGKAQFWKVGSKYEPVADNQFADDDGPFNATPSVSDGLLFIRSDNKLYCIGG